MAESTDTGKESFGELLRRLRGVRGLTQGELAARAGVTINSISMLERGVRRAPRGTTVAFLAGALDLDASEQAQLEAAARSTQGEPAPAVAVGAPAVPLEEQARLRGGGRRRGGRLAAALLGAAMAFITAAGVVSAVGPRVPDLRGVLARPGPVQCCPESAYQIGKGVAADPTAAGTVTWYPRKIGITGIVTSPLRCASAVYTAYAGRLRVARYQTMNQCGRVQVGQTLDSGASRSGVTQLVIGLYIDGNWYAGQVCERRTNSCSRPPPRHGTATP